MTADPPTTTRPVPAFRGWQRQPSGRSFGKWNLVAEGSTEAEVSGKLYALTAGTTGHTDTMILPIDQQP